jgi:hypothetical protein
VTAVLDFDHACAAPAEVAQVLPGILQNVMAMFALQMKAALPELLRFAIDSNEGFRSSSRIRQQSRAQSKQEKPEQKTQGQPRHESKTYIYCKSTVSSMSFTEHINLVSGQI